MAPEYAMHGHLSDKADVYSFGIVALEIVTGRSNNCNQSFHLLDWVNILRVFYIHSIFIVLEIMFQDSVWWVISKVTNNLFQFFFRASIERIDLFFSTKLNFLIGVVIYQTRT